MNSALGDLVSLVLREPQIVQTWSPASWDHLIRQARRADLLSRIAENLFDLGILESVPTAPRRHLQAARVVARAHREAVARELRYIGNALNGLGVDVVLLKGAAYLAAALPPAKGRIFSDIDILVPKEALPEVENQLVRHGWTTTHHNRYDQRYYREWMHELPPMQHAERQTVIDVHHAILPQTARLRPDSTKLLRAAQAVDGHAHLRVLAPADMVLHCATHLFYNEELSNGLRDLADFDSLLRHFARHTAFWPRLMARADELNLRRPLYYGLRYSHEILHAPIPDAFVLGRTPGAPPRLIQAFMDALWLRALRPQHPSTADGFTRTALMLLYVRAHWLRMPPHLLAYHLAHKAFPAREVKTKEPA